MHVHYFSKVIAAFGNPIGNLDPSKKAQAKKLENNPSLKITEETNNSLALEINPKEFTARITTNAKKITLTVTGHP